MTNLAFNFFKDLPTPIFGYLLISIVSNEELLIMNDKLTTALKIS